MIYIKQYVSESDIIQSKIKLYHFKDNVDVEK